MTEQPPIQPTPVGALRFNTDTALLEYFDGNRYVNITIDSPEQNTGGTRGIISGGGTPSQVNIIDFVNLDTTGNATDFGDLNNRVNGPAGSADRTRGITSGGYQAPSNGYINNIDFVTIASTGDAANFGDLTVARGYSAGGSDSTRGLTGGAWGPSNSDVIDYVTIQSTGDAVDFGNLSVARQVDAAVNSPTRVVFTGGCTGPSPFAIGTTDRLDYVTTSTLGNAADFGDVTGTGGDRAGCSSTTRAICALGASNSDTTVNYVQIMSTGNSIDFGDLNQGTYEAGGLSNGHGGLG